MKKQIILSALCLIIFITSSNAQIQSSCNVPPILQSRYDADVKHLALKRIYDQNSQYMDSIKIPDSYQDTIWQGLAAIYNLTSIVQRDSVFDNYCIHQDISNYIYHNIYITVDTSYSWTHQWMNLNITTGITSLDNLLSKYGFTVKSFSKFVGNIATLTTIQNINTAALDDSIAKYSGVTNASTSTNIGDGNKITYTKNGNISYFDFTLGYGDCEAGCSCNHTFKFLVYDNCSVEYLGVGGNYVPGIPMPLPVNCNITENVKNVNSQINLKIYPNPAEDFINIETNLLSNTNYSISNLYGQLLRTGELTKENKISIIDFSEGIYLIRFYNNSNNEIGNYKFIKE